MGFRRRWRAARRAGWLVGLCASLAAAHPAGRDGARPTANATAARPAPAVYRPATAPKEITPAALRRYQDAFFHRHLSALGGYLTGYQPRSFPAGVPPHRIEVLRTSIGYALVTSGLGLLPQGSVSGPRRVELVAYTPREGPPIAHVLSTVGERMFGPEAKAAPFEAWKTIVLPHRLYGARGFALLPAGDPLRIAGVQVTVLEVVPLTDAEVRSFSHRPAQALQDWATRHPLPERSSRWLAVLARKHP